MQPGPTEDAAPDVLPLTTTALPLAPAGLPAELPLGDAAPLPPEP
jgi:hypothetical protein